jgi:hypothetical protein
MAETFKHIQASLTTSETTLYTAPSNGTSIIFMAQVSNIDAFDGSTVTLKAYDSSAATNKFLSSNVIIPAKTVAGLLTGKLVLEANDSIAGKAAANNFIDIVLSVLEIT